MMKDYTNQTLYKGLLAIICLITVVVTSTAQTCTTKEFLYVNDPHAATVYKFQITSNVALTEVIGANGGPHWYPGTGISELGNPHGLATDLNGKLYIGESGNTGKLRRLNCDGVLDPVSPATITTQQDYTQNIFSIGNIIYHNSTGGPTAYNSCTGERIGKMCLAGASTSNQWGLSYNPTTELVYASDRENGLVWVFTKGQLEAGIAGNPGNCIDPLVQVPATNEVFGIVSDNSGNFYVCRRDGFIFKYNSSGTLVDQVDIAVHNSWLIGITWSSSTNRLYVSNFNSNDGEDCISVIDASSMTYLGAGLPNPTGGGGGNAAGSKAIAILKESCPVSLPTAFSRNICGAIGKKFYLNQEAFSGCDGIVCGSSWAPISMAGMTFDPCDNSVTITGQGCGVFTLNTGAVSSSGCPAQSSTFTICNTFPPNIIVTTQATCTPNGTYTLTGTVTVDGGAPPTGTLTVNVRGGGFQTFNAPFATVTNFSIPNITSYGGERNVYANFSDNNCSKAQPYIEPKDCPICTLPLATNITLSQTVPTCTGSTSDNNGKITLTMADNTDKCGISTLNASTYDGPLYASAIAYTANKDVKTTIPNTGGTYILRLYNTSDLCYKDTAIVVLKVNSKPNAGPDQTLACTNVATNTLTTSTTLVPITSGGTFTQIGITPAVASIAGNAVSGMTVAGTYQFQYSVSGCLDTVAVTVSPCSGCIKLDAGPDISVCQPTTGNYKLNDAPSGQTWGVKAGTTSSINATTGAITGLTAGVHEYILQVSGSSDCADTVKITVNIVPDLSITTTPATCKSTGGNANDDAKINLVNTNNGIKVDYVSGSIFTGTKSYSSLPTGMPSGNFITLPNPAVTKNYTIRLYNQGGTCFTDKTVELKHIECPLVCPLNTCLTLDSNKN